VGRRLRMRIWCFKRLLADKQMGSGYCRRHSQNELRMSVAMHSQLHKESYQLPECLGDAIANWKVRAKLHATIIQLALTQAKI
jgi:hypothetical protein